MQGEYESAQVSAGMNALRAIRDRKERRKLKRRRGPSAPASRPGQHKAHPAEESGVHGKRSRVDASGRTAPGKGAMAGRSKAEGKEQHLKAKTSGRPVESAKAKDSQQPKKKIYTLADLERRLAPAADVEDDEDRLLRELERKIGKRTRKEDADDVMAQLGIGRSKSSIQKMVDAEVTLEEPHRPGAAGSSTVNSMQQRGAAWDPEPNDGHQST